MMMTSLPPRNHPRKPSRLQNRFPNQLSNHHPKQVFFFYSFWRFVEYYDWEGKKSRLESAFRPFYFLLIDRHTKKRVGQISGRHRGRSRVKVIDPVPVCIHHIHRHAHTLEIIYDMKRKKYRHFIFLHQLQKKLLEWEDDKIERIQNFKVTFY